MDGRLNLCASAASGILRVAVAVVFLLALPLGPCAWAFPTAAAWEHLIIQCEMGPRNPGSEGHRRCGAYIRQVLEAAGGRVSLQRFLHKAPGLPKAVELTNFLARFGPLRDGGLLLGAHWDTRPWADQDPDPRVRQDPILGANDGASGVALLLALAETFRERPPEIPILMVFFDGEDLGRANHPEEWCAGSRYYAAHLPGPFPSAGLIFDMVASESMVLTVEEQSRQLFPEMAKLIDQLAAELGLVQFHTGSGPMVLDDHIPLIEAGLPTLDIIDFRDPVWHTQQDLPRHCSRASLEAAGRLAERLVRGGFF